MKAGLLHGLGNLLPGLTGLLTAPLTARALGVEDRGVVTVLLTASSLFAVAATAGLGWGARTAVGRDPGAATSWARSARWVAVVAVAPASVLVFWLSGAWHLNSAEVLGLAVLFVLVSAAAIRSVQGNILVAVGSLARLGLSNIALAGVTACLIVVLFVMGQLTVATVLAANALGLLAQSGVLLHALRKERSRVVWRASVSGGHSGTTIASARPKLFMTALAQTLDALSSRLDVLLVAAVGSARSLGLYSVAAVLPQMSYFLYLTLSQRSYAKSPNLSLEHRSRLLFLVCLGGGLVFATVGGAVGWIFIEPVFGRAFGPARHFLWPAMAVTVGLGTLIPTLLGWQRGGSSAALSVGAVVAVAAFAAVVGLAVDAWWAVIALGLGLTVMGLSQHVRRWGWLSLIQGHRAAWNAVIRGVP